MTSKHFTQGLAYKNSFDPNEVVEINCGSITAIGYVKQLPLGIKILYIPHAPALDPTNQADFSDWQLEAKKIARHLGCAFVRFDPQLPNSGTEIVQSLHRSPLSAYRSFFIQPRFEWQAAVIPLAQLLNSFSKGTRRDYNLAEREGLVINFYNEFSESVFDAFYSLLQQTAKAQNFKPQTKNYIRRIVSSTLNSQAGFLALVYKNNQPLAGALIITEDHTGFYVYGGLNYKAQVIGTATFMHSKIIDHCFSLGFRHYNLGSIDHQNLFPAYAGLTVFKQKFPGEVIDYGRLYDLIIDPIWYYVYTLIRWWRDFLKQLKRAF